MVQAYISEGTGDSTQFVFQ